MKFVFNELSKENVFGGRVEMRIIRKGYKVTPKSWKS